MIRLLLPSLCLCLFATPLLGSIALLFRPLHRDLLRNNI